MRVICLLLLIVAPVTACVIPMDSGSNAIGLAMEQMDAAVYAMRDENALLQAQLDSLARELRKTDSLLRVIANLTGNPIVDPPKFQVLPPPLP